MEDKKIKIGDKEYSGVKSLGWLTKFFSLKTLALNPLSGTANFVGGTGNAFFKLVKEYYLTHLIGHHQYMI